MLWSGDLDGAHDQLTTSLEIAREIGNLLLQDQCLAYLAILYRLRGDRTLLHKLLPQTREIAQIVNYPAYIGVYQAKLAWLDYLDRDWTAAHKRSLKALSEWGDSSYPFKWLAYWILLAINLDRDMLEEAVESARAMLDPIQQCLPDEVTAVLEQCLHHWEDRDLDSTRKMLKRAVELAKQWGYL